MAQWLSWLERRPVTAKVESSSLFWVVSNELTSLVNCIWIWNLSSAGRASALQAEGHRFEPYRFHILKENGEIAQLARAHGSYPWCRGFESPSRYLTEKSVTNKYGILAQLGEHLPYKQRVIGSSPIGSIS